MCISACIINIIDTVVNPYYYSILKLKNDMSARQPAESTDATAKEEEVVMGSNAAYETVELRYQTPSSRQTAQPPTGGSGREEPLYECPAS